ncbi:hypothetical protein ACOMICROBIO_LMKGKHOH_04012 [Vibrio sp. B1FIG11]|nr:hypothetical protein A1Q_3039 [Vibrio campbellii HY01]CAD7827173.1 hypothetical protein ACOMICROBIO_LMKGKHOH_04012 [Vibrio sp. B1FIG11]CAE6950842.1 hypothetical protein ACOMICROBIO_LKFPLAJE_04304 [Vibrio sp. B1FIG11]CAE6963014.1 hypothetical protein ACOMICROBIO_LMKGKHOH_04012 [Vibrio sp. B1FIG11]
MSLGRIEYSYRLLVRNLLFELDDVAIGCHIIFSIILCE